MKRVLLGMSGGIDSSVAAILLKEQGYEVIGATLRLWSETDSFDSNDLPQYLIDAKELAQKLQIEHHVIDVKREFYDKVITYFKGEYLNGRTPNPCAKCNVVLKWNELNKKAIQLNCEGIATGHYVNKVQKGSTFYIEKGIDPEKEQSFFLWGLGQEILGKAIFPLGNLTKTQVKEKAESLGFVALNKKKESTGMCFLSDKNYQAFLGRELKGQNILPGHGDFIDNNGNKLGVHNGYAFYTVGQRRGLGLVPKEPYYVTNIYPETNQVQLGVRDDLYQKSMFVESYNIMNKDDFASPVITRIRYRKQAAESVIEFIDDRLLKVNFINEEWSIAPGQTAAFYNGDTLLGGGFIK